MLPLHRYSPAFISTLILTAWLFEPMAGWANAPAHKSAHPIPAQHYAPSKAISKSGTAGKPNSVRKTGGAPATKTAVIVSPNAFIPYYYQGRELYNHENFAGAEKPLKLSLGLAEKVYAKKPDANQRKNLVIVTSLVGYNAFKLKKYAESSRYLKQSLSIYNLPEFYQESKDAIMHTLLTLGQMAMYEGQYAEAQAFYQQALPLQEQKLGPADEQVQRTREILDEIARIEYGPNYLAELGAKVTHWSHPEQPITIYIEDGSNISNWKPEDSLLVQNAYAEWQQALSNQVHFEFVTNPQDADMVIRWMERPKASDSESDPAKPKELRNGECQTQSRRDVLIQDDIVIALNNTDGKPMSANKIHHTALHEIGHSLGLSGGHSRNPADVLFPNDRYEDGRPTHLSQRDIQTMQLLYAKIPVVTNPVGIHLVHYNQYATLIVEGGKLFGMHAYQPAANAFRNALSIYNREPETRYWLGSSLFQLNQYADALPYLRGAASVPGERQGEALKLTGYVLIKSGESDDKAGAIAIAEQKYRRAYQLLSQGLQTIPVQPDNKKAILEELTWLNQRFALGGQTIQWVSEQPAQGAPKKKGWFLDFLSSFTSVAVPIQGPQ